MTSHRSRLASKPEYAGHTRRFAAGVAVLSLELLIGGCSGYALKSGLPADYVVGSDASHGIVLVSVGAIPEPALGWNSWSYYEFRSVNKPKLLGNVASAKKHNFGFTPGCDDDGLPEECGHLYALVLPAGEYEFCRVIPDLDRHQSDTFHSEYYDTPMERYRFVVRAGGAAYLGNLVSRICAGAASGRGNTILSAVGRVVDRYERDVPLLVTKFPQLSENAIRNESMTGSPWLWRYKDGIDFVPYGDQWPSECSLDPASIDAYLG